MFKIKDDKNLKDLRVFGFEYDEKNFYWKHKDFITNIGILDEKHWAKANREICNVRNERDLEIFFDLTKAGFVEKSK